ncbi:DUF397 domain-containing protein [Yinghuangia soli]|uniref:DUF397 domain-containing protein n=1 Tax=Yinghuangia soli TaxID=2908204 RepID=A0AA41U351_9ACTN|nr:DUF397 domain-containing protein [Yinghuangia soli]MCF2531391.1 DUF397 domain-containing protein [Yinghuangia soli]
MTEHTMTLAWRTSTYSVGEDQCVEVAPLPAHIALRDSKRPELAAFRFPASAWSELVDGLRR